MIAFNQREYSCIDHMLTRSRFDSGIVELRMQEQHLWRSYLDAKAASLCEANAGGPRPAVLSFEQVTGVMAVELDASGIIRPTLEAALCLLARLGSAVRAVAFHIAGFIRVSARNLEGTDRVLDDLHGVGVPAENPERPAATPAVPSEAQHTLAAVARRFAHHRRLALRGPTKAHAHVPA